MLRWILRALILLVLAHILLLVVVILERDLQGLAIFRLAFWLFNLLNRRAIIFWVRLDGIVFVRVGALVWRSGGHFFWLFLNLYRSPLALFWSASPSIFFLDRWRPTCICLTIAAAFRWIILHFILRWPGNCFSIPCLYILSQERALKEEGFALSHAWLRIFEALLEHVQWALLHIRLVSTCVNVPCLFGIL